MEKFADVVEMDNDDAAAVAAAAAAAAAAADAAGDRPHSSASEATMPRGE